MRAAGAVAGPAPAVAGWAGDLTPVEAALREAAARHAAVVRARADEEAAAVSARAARESADVLQRARGQGTAAARAAARGRLAEARRRGGTSVLAARDEAYRSLRSGVLAELQARLDTPDGVRLRSYLLARVARRGGAPAVEQPGPDGTWRAVSGSGATVAAVDLEAVVDQVLRRFAPEVAGLWM